MPGSEGDTVATTRIIWLQTGRVDELFYVVDLHDVRFLIVSPDLQKRMGCMRSTRFEFGFVYRPLHARNTKSISNWGKQRIVFGKEALQQNRVVDGFCGLHAALSRRLQGFLMVDFVDLQDF